MAGSILKIRRLRLRLEPTYAALVERMNGLIDFESEPYVRTSFYVELPAAVHATRALSV